MIPNRKSFGLQILRRFFGNGLVSSEGDFWQRQRRLTQPAFHRERIFGYGEVMVEYTQKLLTTWQEGEVRRICIGKSFAMMEAVLLLATIAQNYQLKLTPQEIIPWAAFSLRPKHEIKMLLAKRDA